MSLQETIDSIVNDKRERKINQIQKRIDEMTDKWWSEQMQKACEISMYYYKKSDEKARQKVIALRIERMEEIYNGYKEILQQAKVDAAFDVFLGLEELKKKVAVYDDELKKWRKDFHRYKGSEKYDFCLRENNL